MILGAGKMGSFFVDLLSFEHTTAVYDIDPKRLRFMYNTERFTTLEEIAEFKPELVINAVTLKYTLDVFKQVMPYLPSDCILSDISSVKTGLREFYEQCGRRYVSTHPMFGPTFANLGALSNENAIIITEGDYMGRIFLRTSTAAWDFTSVSTPSMLTMKLLPILWAPPSFPPSCFLPS